ncbi:Mitochondrial substrate carrier [Cordyceps militaris]|uniref:Mitochondrial substrate carrier n=1 Tax=Cordyceps militaris TaxID=73501 RepID=A0A2H4SNA8_CORMI|nr:Mitochondrial substrate carrier [Cordyceps militaris]
MAFTAKDTVKLSPVSREATIRRSLSPWVHLAAGASGGLVNAIVTSPLDVLRTRMQSDLFIMTSTSEAVRTSRLGFLRRTLAALSTMHRTEGFGGLFRGLVPSLVGVVPAQAVKFYVYGNCKRLGAQGLGRSESDALVHAQAAVAAGLATATVTNPIWLVKTRLQLDKDQSRGGALSKQYSGSIDCVRKIWKHEGLPGFYRGLSASYLGTLETVVHLVLYEQLKTLSQTQSNEASPSSTGRTELGNWVSTAGAAGCAKVAAVLLTYPHEVVRTRLRQAPSDSFGAGNSSLVQCCRSTWARQGWRGFYSGLTVHLVRSIPSAVITLGIYEFVLRLAGAHSNN